MTDTLKIEPGFLPDDPPTWVCWACEESLDATRDTDLITDRQWDDLVIQFKADHKNCASSKTEEDETMTLTYHTDPGHGWLEVSFYALADVGLTPADFSRYSYVGPAGGEVPNPQRDEYGSPVIHARYYLEEDCDMSKFMIAFKSKHGRHPDLVEAFANPSFVRGLPRLGRAT